MTAKSPMNQYIGYCNRENGKRFEQMIESANEVYRLRGIAEISKTPEPMKPLSPLGGGKYVACFEGKAEADFKGTRAGGRAVCFEAKHTETGKIEQRVVTDAQTAYLSRHAKIGAECFVMVSFGLMSFHRIPWGVWRNMKEIYGHKYLTPDEAAQYRVKLVGGVIDYLGMMDAKKRGEK